jgi:hypothetical protein
METHPAPAAWRGDHPVEVPMAKALLITVAVLALTASIASADDIRLAWDDCLGAGGATNRTFACDTNVGNNDLYVSFVPSVDAPDVNGLNPIVDVYGSTPGPLPSWWQMKNAGSCRLTALSAPTIAGSCAGIWSGQQVASIAAYIISPNFPANIARIIGSVSVPGAFAAAVHPGTEYTAMVIRINNTKTTGLGACEGCQEQICLEVAEVLLTTNNSGDFRLRNPGNCSSPPPAGWSFCPCPGIPGTSVSWQGPSTPTLNRTWGQVKSFYR